MSLNLAWLFGRMYLDCYPVTGGEISPGCCIHWEGSGITAPGGYLTRNISECHNGAGAYSDVSLDQILEPSPDPKYWLSPTACSGILRRAEASGRPLPERLLEALEQRAADL